MGDIEMDYPNIIPPFPQLLVVKCSSDHWSVNWKGADSGEAPECSVCFSFPSYKKAEMYTVKKAGALAATQ